MFLSVEMLLWFDESMSRNRDWAYLAATTFQLFDEKWTFQLGLCAMVLHDLLLYFWSNIVSILQT